MQDRAPRRNPSGLAAMHGSASFPKLDHIQVISSTGLYLRTTDRWPVGEVVTLTLQKEGESAHNSELHIEVQARVACWGEDGVGLGFILPRGMNVGLWEHLIAIADAPTETEDSQFIFRMVHAILFLYRLCPSKNAEPIFALTGELDEFRTRSMLAIVLRVERMLAAEPDAEQMHADPCIVESIFKDGTWEHDELTEQLWAGLLASSCSLEGNDQSNKDLVELLVQVTTCQAHILAEGCRRVEMRPADDHGSVTTPVNISPEEMIAITGKNDLYRNATDVAYLNIYGLIEKSFDFSTHALIGSFDITPSPLGIRLFRACRGHLLADAMFASHRQSRDVLSYRLEVASHG